MATWVKLGPGKQVAGAHKVKNAPGSSIRAARLPRGPSPDVSGRAPNGHRPQAQEERLTRRRLPVGVLHFLKPSDWYSASAADPDAGVDDDGHGGEDHAQVGASLVKKLRNAVVVQLGSEKGPSGRPRRMGNCGDQGGKDNGQQHQGGVAGIEVEQTARPAPISRLPTSGASSEGRQADGGERPTPSSPGSTNLRMPSSRNTQPQSPDEDHGKISAHRSLRGWT